MQKFVEITFIIQFSSACALILTLFDPIVCTVVDVGIF